LLSPSRPLIRSDGGIYVLERALRRRGFAVVAGADEAGRGACAGPLVAAAVVLPDRREIEGLNDSKLLTQLARERIFEQVMATAVTWAAIVVEPEQIDERGLHVGNVAAMRRAIAKLTPAPSYVLTDGFAVDGIGAPGLAVWKGDQVAACVAAASVVAKVTRDRMMTELDSLYPEYGFAEHKGYSTPEHAAALREHGPSPVHRHSYKNVAATWLTAHQAGRRGTVSSVELQKGGSRER
jgi:ribonuclease HII